MAKMKKRFWYIIDRDHLEAQQVSTVLDMLRYDQAILHSNPPPGYYLFSCPQAPCVERWNAFLIGIHQYTRGAQEFPPFGENWGGR